MLAVASWIAMATLARALANGPPAAPNGQRIELTEVTIRMADMRFTPDTVRAVAGQPLMLTFVNEDDVAHDFVMNGGAQPVHLFVPPRRSIATSLFFERAATIEFECSQPGHKVVGMVGQFFVEGVPEAAVSARAEPERCEPGIPGLIAWTEGESRADVAALGRRLFFDRRLSVDGTVSCATCHVPERAFSDGRSRAVGAGGRVGRRNSPTLYNVAYLPAFLWDGRAASLEQQVMIALTHPDEMRMTEELLEWRLRDERGAFMSRLGAPPSMRTVARALAAFERTLLAGNTPVDRFLYCGSDGALDARERRGLEVFSGDGNCVRCHTFAHETVHPFGGRMALFTDNRFHNIGAGRLQDPGRAAVTGQSKDWGAFKTPTLRNVALTAPYMHDGSLATLEEVVDFYDKGGGRNARLDPRIRPLRLSATDRDALVAFLRALTSPGAVLHADVASAGR